VLDHRQALSRVESLLHISGESRQLKRLDGLHSLGRLKSTTEVLEVARVPRHRPGHNGRQVLYLILIICLSFRFLSGLLGVFLVRPSAGTGLAQLRGAPGSANVELALPPEDQLGLGLASFHILIITHIY
jgi:hypothetical protein